MLPGPLAGVRVLDLSHVVSGPVCGRMLADLGADVIKVEAPSGDIIRTLAPHGTREGVGPYFSYANAGKRDVCIDLRTDDGADLVGRMAATSDVLLENFRPGTLARRGLGAEDLLARTPGLIYCSISGWGQDGPWAQRRAYAPLVEAETGRIELAARLRDAPAEFGVHVEGDIYPGLLAVSAILAALYQREHTGAGQHLDVAMAEALVYTDEWASTDLAGFGRDRIPDTWTYPILTLGDGTAVTLLGNAARQLATLVDALAPPAHPSRIAVDPNGAAVPIPQALLMLEELFAAVPDYSTLEARLEPRAIQVAQVRSVSELADTEWAIEREVFTEVEPGTRVVRAPFRSAQARIGVQGPAPMKGEHTRAVLSELLGLDAAELDALEASGAIC